MLHAFSAGKARPHIAGLAPIVLLLALGCRALAQDQESPLTKDERDAFAWFDGLGFPDLKGSKLVHVEIVNDPEKGRGTIHLGFGAAFLLSEDEKSFTIFAGLETKVIQRHGDMRNFGPTIASYKPADPARAVEAIEDASHYTMTTRAAQILEIRGQAFVLARGLARIGQEALAHELCSKIMTMRERVMGQKESGAKDLKGIVAHDIARALVAHINLSFETPGVLRREILEKAEHYLAHFPDGEHAAWAKEIATNLRAMIAEDEAHAKTAKPLESLGEDERLAELVFRLRDQYGVWMRSFEADWFGRDIFAPEPKAANAMLEIAPLGTAAVPQLLKALPDRTYTRSVQHYNMESNLYPKEIIRVGDVALRVLERLSGRSFCEYAFPGACSRSDESLFRDPARPTSRDERLVSDSSRR